MLWDTGFNETKEPEMLMNYADMPITMRNYARDAYGPSGILAALIDVDDGIAKTAKILIREHAAYGEKVFELIEIAKAVDENGRPGGWRYCVNGDPWAAGSHAMVASYEPDQSVAAAAVALGYVVGTQIGQHKYAAAYRVLDEVVEA